jgi:hypothetical protein
VPSSPLLPLDLGQRNAVAFADQRIHQGQHRRRAPFILLSPLSFLCSPAPLRCPALLSSVKAKQEVAQTEQLGHSASSHRNMISTNQQKVVSKTSRLCVAI